MKFIFIFISLLIIDNAISPCILFRCGPGEEWICPPRKTETFPIKIRLEPFRICPGCRCVPKKGYDNFIKLKDKIYNTTSNK